MRPQRKYEIPLEPFYPDKEMPEKMIAKMEIFMFAVMMPLIFMILSVLNILGMAELVNSSYAKTYTPLYAEVVAEIPDDVVLPSYMDKLEQAYMLDELAGDGSVLKISVYKEMETCRLSPEGEEIYPYIEVIKWESNGLHLIRLSFIDDEGHQQDFFDEKALMSPATDILRRYIPKSIVRGFLIHP